MLANAIKNHERVINDAQSIVNDFNNNQFDKAGQDIGDLLIALIGPVPSSLIRASELFSSEISNKNKTFSVKAFTVLISASEL